MGPPPGSAAPVKPWIGVDTGASQEWKDEFQGWPCFVERAMFCYGRAILAMSSAACVSDRQYKQSKGCWRNPFMQGAVMYQEKQMCPNVLSPDHEFFY